MEHARVLLVGGLFLLLGTVAVVALRSAAPPNAPITGILERDVDIRLGSGVRVHAMEEGAGTLLLEAADATYRRAADEIALSAVHITVPRGSYPPVAIAGPHGRYDVAARRFSLRGGVQVTMETLTASMASADYHLATRMIRSPDPVTAISPRMVVTGTGFAGNLDTHQVSVLDDVHVQARPSSQSSDAVLEAMP